MSFLFWLFGGVSGLPFGKYVKEETVDIFTEVLGDKNWWFPDVLRFPLYFSFGDLFEETVLSLSWGVLEETVLLFFVMLGDTNAMEVLDWLSVLLLK